MSNAGPPPSAARSRGIGSTGVGAASSGSDGRCASAARSAAGVTRRYSKAGGRHHEDTKRNDARPSWFRRSRGRMDLLSALRGGTPVLAAELRPPRAELALAEGMDAWIDTCHAVRRLTRQGTFVFLTDSAVGAEEEDNLRHLVTNLGRDLPRERIVPFLTSKHSLDYCASYAERARQHGFPALV